MDLQVNQANIIDPYVNESYCRCLHLFLRRPEARNKEDAFEFPCQSKVGNIQTIKRGEKHTKSTLSYLKIYPALTNLVVSSVRAKLVKTTINLMVVLP